jgi:hypothetical protein
MGFWEINTFGFLLGLSCRLWDFKFTTFQTGERGDYNVAFVIEMGGKLYSAMGDGKFKKIAR